MLFENCEFCTPSCLCKWIFAHPYIIHMPYINPYTSWNKPVCELGKQKFWRYQHVCVPHTEHLQNSNWNVFWFWFWETLRVWRSSISVSHSGYAVSGSLVCIAKQEQRGAETHIFAEILKNILTSQSQEQAHHWALPWLPGIAFCSLSWCHILDNPGVIPGVSIPGRWL